MMNIIPYFRDVIVRPSRRRRRRRRATTRERERDPCHALSLL